MCGIAGGQGVNVNVTVGGGDNDPPMPRGRNAVYHFVCDANAPLGNGPDPAVVESPDGFYNIVWYGCKLGDTQSWPAIPV